MFYIMVLSCLAIAYWAEGGHLVQAEPMRIPSLEIWN